MKIDRLAAQTMAMAVASARPWIATPGVCTGRTADGSAFGSYGTHVSNADKRPEGLRGSPG